MPVLDFDYFVFSIKLFPARMLRADIVFGGVCLSVCLYVCLTAQNLENYWSEMW